MGIRDYVLNPTVIRALNESIRRALTGATARSLGRVIVVDANRASRRALRSTLVQAGYEVVTARNSQAALRKHYRRPADLIVTGLFGRGVDGLETIEEMRCMTPDVKFVVTVEAGAPETEYMDGVRIVTGAPVLTRPTRPEELLPLVRRVLSRR